MKMTKIISDSPYRSRRMPIRDEQIRYTVRSTKIGEKETMRFPKKQGQKGKKPRNN